jgi:hypothetical protein
MAYHHAQGEHVAEKLKLRGQQLHGSPQLYAQKDEVDSRY